MEEVRYMISEASKRVDVEAHVLRYWQKQLGLPISRNEMEQRYYKEADIELFKKVKILKERGFQLKAIKMLISDLDKPEMLDAQAEVFLIGRQDGKEQDMQQDEKEREKNEMGKEDMGKDELEKEGLGKDRLKDEGLQKEEPGSGEPEEGGTSLIAESSGDITEGTGSKMDQFKAVLSHIVLEALKENNIALSQDISANVTDGVIKEMNYLMRLQEEKEEERYRKFDATLRDYQKSRMMSAATTDRRKKSKFFKKNRVYI
ncbi:DNA-binding transcriptional MerR regulator [Anaerotaenia torta]|uniref:helix-turn-helix domain-containing protein n=1 Tax=Anaerotaenia torta TaxID=433293 RepID=UPI003D23F117